MADHVSKKRVRDDSAEIESPEAKRIRDDLLDFLDESDPTAPTPDLDSVMQSFAEEISSESPLAPAVIRTEYSGQSQPELGYLLEASDDELGLPPSTTPSEVKSDEPDSVRVPFDSAGIGELWGFGDELQGFDSFEFGIGDCNGNGNGNGNGEYLALGGLFDYSDAGFGSSELSDLSWRSETLPAL